MEYHKTKDILHVMRMLGHRNINNTLKYTQLIKTDDEFISKVAKTVEEACALVEAGYEYVTEFQEKESKSSGSVSNEIRDADRGWICGAGGGI